VTPPSDPTAFFERAKARSLHKLDLLDGYLKPFTYKVGSRAGAGRPQRHVWIVDGFAGAGSYRRDGDGRSQDGSPLIAAKWAKRIAIERRYPLVRCINVERDRRCHEQLVRHLAPWPDVAIALRGEFADHLDDILDTIDDDPALFFLDPFGVVGIEMQLVEQIAARRGKTELLLHFSDRTFLRMAGHLDDHGKRLPVGHKQAQGKLATLDALMGTKRWRLLCPPGADTEDAIDQVADLYLHQLREGGWTFADQIRMRDHYADRPAYRLMFATRSPHGIEVMSDRACRYERSLKDEADAGIMTLWHHDDERQHLTDLRDRIFAAGRERGTATREQIIHQIAPEAFGRYTSTDYAKAIRELVGLGLIDRPHAKGIEPREPLRFVDPPQASLLDA
jgi:three-Cys-motif partner protein